jgi:hypothetical protein
MGKKIRIRIRDEQPGSNSESLQEFKYFNSKNCFMWIRDGKYSEKFGSGINFLDPQHWNQCQKVLNFG